jgi:hypothetical protein
MTLSARQPAVFNITMEDLKHNTSNILTSCIHDFAGEDGRELRAVNSADL